MDKGSIIFNILVTITLITIVTALVVALDTPQEKTSPYDRISENQIHVYSDKIIIDIGDASWASYADTNSMDPILDYGANGLELIPQSENDLFIGDIVAYESKITNDLIVHRIIDIKEDESGKYFTLKGDNNRITDPERVKFSQIKYVLIGVLY